MNYNRKKICWNEEKSGWRNNTNHECRKQNEKENMLTTTYRQITNQTSHIPIVHAINIHYYPWHNGTIAHFTKPSTHFPHHVKSNNWKIESITVLNISMISKSISNVTETLFFFSRALMCTHFRSLTTILNPH